MNRMTRLAALVLLCMALCLPAHAAGLPVELCGAPLNGALLEEDTTFVPLRAFCEALGSAVGWDQKTETVTVTDGDFKASVALGSTQLRTADGTIALSDAPFCREGVTYIPVRGLAALYGLEVTWLGLDEGVRLTERAPAYSSTDLYWLSRIIFAESGNQPLEGMVAVGNVVMNRVRSDQYPDTVKGVIFDTRYGTQFTPAKSGSIYKEPSDEAVKAAKLVLEGAEAVPEETLYFISTKVSSSHWIKRACRLVTTIGGHAFYANPA